MLCWARQWLLVADFSCDFTLGTAKVASPLIAPHMMQGPKSTFKKSPESQLVLTAYAMPMALLWCQPQKLREKTRSDCGVIWACLYIKSYTVPGHLSFGNNYCFIQVVMPERCLDRKHTLVSSDVTPRSQHGHQRQKRYRDTLTDTIHFSLKMKCPFEEMNCTMKVPVVLQKQKGFLVDMYLSPLEDT